MGVLEQKTQILQHSWQFLALVLIQSLGLLCCIHLHQDAAGINPLGCTGALRVGNARGWGDPTFAPAAQEQSSSLSDTYLLSFSLITCQQGYDCLDFLAVLLFSPTKQKPK